MSHDDDNKPATHRDTVAAVMIAVAIACLGLAVSALLGRRWVGSLFTGIPPERMVLFTFALVVACGIVAVIIFGDYCERGDDQ